MPLVQAMINTRQGDFDRLAAAQEYALTLLAVKLRAACMELVPAALNTAEGELWPDNIEFGYQFVAKSGMACDVTINIYAQVYDDRLLVLKERTKSLHAALKSLFPDIAIAVFPFLGETAWETDFPDEVPEEDTPMDMESAANRAFIRVQACQGPYLAPAS